jgi:hypothetical protein
MNKKQYGEGKYQRKSTQYITTRIEKTATEDMEIMCDFIKKHFQGRFYRKSRNVEEFIEDVSEYF